MERRTFLKLLGIGIAAPGSVVNGLAGVAQPTVAAAVMTPVAVNRFITPDLIAKEALAALERQMVIAGLPLKSLTSAAKLGDTIRIGKPSSFT